MRNILTIVTVAFGVVLIAGPAFAQTQTVPEPMSMSVLAGGIAAIAAVRRVRRK